LPLILQKPSGEPMKNQIENKSLSVDIKLLIFYSVAFILIKEILRGLFVSISLFVKYNTLLVDGKLNGKFNRPGESFELWEVGRLYCTILLHLLTTNNVVLYPKNNYVKNESLKKDI